MNRSLRIVLFWLLTAPLTLAQTAQTVRYEYDALNRLTRATYPNSVTVIYNYDVLGNRTSVVVSQPSTGQPDLTVTNQTVSPVSVGVGGSLQASCTVSNLQTTAASSAFRLRFYLSADNQFNAGDTEVGTSQTVNAPFLGEQTVSTTINLPANVSGSRFILFFVDADNQVTNEVNESNNVAASAITITTSNPCPTITVSVNTNSTTQGGATGSASANASGGQSPYGYVWSNGGAGQSISGLATGTYSVTATDANGCKGVGSGTVSSTTSGSCTAMISVRTGNWNDPGTWSCNRVPVSTDVVQVVTGHTVTIPASVTANAQRVQDYGRIIFGTGAKLMLAITSPPSSTTTTPPTVDITTGLLAFYSFDGNVNDVSGNNRNGTAIGGLTYTTNRTGTANKAAIFDGVDDGVDTPYTQSNLSEFTVSVWVKTDLGIAAATNPSAIIQNRNTATGRSITLDYDRSDGAWSMGLDADFTRLVRRVVYTNPNAWRHIVGVWTGVGSAFNSNQFKLYINGVLQTTTAINAGSGSIPFSASGTMKIGYHQPWNTYFRGSLDDLRIYNRALTDAQVQALANQ